MEIIKEKYASDTQECQSRPDCYWICGAKNSNSQEEGERGLLAKIQEELRDKKRYYKAQKDKNMEKLTCRALRIHKSLCGSPTGNDS
jgi:hypothetical protein